MQFKFVKQIFDKNWHKLHFGVFYDRVVLYIDCKQIDVKLLESRGTVDILGNTEIMTNNDYQAASVSFINDHIHIIISTITIIPKYVNTSTLGGCTMDNS